MLGREARVVSGAKYMGSRARNEQGCAATSSSPLSLAAPMREE